MQKGMPSEVGNDLPSLNVEGEKLGLPTTGPAVLSCGGIFFPRAKIPPALATWRPIIHTSSREVSARTYSMTSQEAPTPLQEILSKGYLN